MSILLNNSYGEHTDLLVNKQISSLPRHCVNYTKKQEKIKSHHLIQMLFTRIHSYQNICKCNGQQCECGHEGVKIYTRIRGTYHLYANFQRHLIQPATTRTDRLHQLAISPIFFSKKIERQICKFSFAIFW